MTSHSFWLKVTFDGGEVELDVEPHRLRWPEEMNRRAKGGCEQAFGPDWERRAVRPVMGVRVAVFGYCEPQVCRLVVDILGGEFYNTRNGTTGALLLPYCSQCTIDHDTPGRILAMSYLRGTLRPTAAISISGVRRS